MTMLEWNGYGSNVPDTQDNFKALRLGGRDDVQGGVAVASRVCTNEGREPLQRVKVGLIVLRGLAAFIRVLVAQ